MHILLGKPGLSLQQVGPTEGCSPRAQVETTLQAGAMLPCHRILEERIRWRAVPPYSLCTAVSSPALLSALLYCLALLLLFIPPPRTSRSSRSPSSACLWTPLTRISRRRIASCRCSTTPTRTQTQVQCGAERAAGLLCLLGMHCWVPCVVLIDQWLPHALLLLNLQCRHLQLFNACTELNSVSRLPW